MESLSLVSKWGNLNRYLGLASLIVGIVTAALDVTFGGFAPILWFLIAILAFIIVVCTEVVQLRLLLESKKDKQENQSYLNSSLLDIRVRNFVQAQSFIKGQACCIVANHIRTLPPAQVLCLPFQICITDSQSSGVTVCLQQGSWEY